MKSRESGEMFVNCLLACLCLLLTLYLATSFFFKKTVTTISFHSFPAKSSIGHT